MNLRIESRIPPETPKSNPNRISPARAGLMGALAVMTPAAIMGAIELDDALNRDSTQVVETYDTPVDVVTLPTDTGDARIDVWNAAHNKSDVTHPDPKVRETSQEAAKEALGFQGD